MSFLQNLNVQSDWLFLPLWIMLVPAIYGQLALAYLCLTQPLAANLSAEDLQKRISTECPFNHSVSVDWLSLPFIVRSPLRVLIDHRDHPGRWELAEVEIAKEAKRFLTITTLVIQVPVLIGLALTLLGIQSTIQTLAHSQYEMETVIDGFAVALSSSFVGLCISAPTYIVRAIGGHLFASRNDHVTRCLMDLEVLYSRNDENHVLTHAASESPLDDQQATADTIPDTTISSANQQLHHVCTAPNPDSPQNKHAQSTGDDLRSDAPVGLDVHSFDPVPDSSDDPTVPDSASDTNGQNWWPPRRRRQE